MNRSAERKSTDSSAEYKADGSVEREAVDGNASASLRNATPSTMWFNSSSAMSSASP